MLFGAERVKKSWFDRAKVLNPYKDFWAAAESENIYENNDEFLATFIFRFIYQQLPFLIFPERVEYLFDHARKLYAGDAAIAKQFEDRAKTPLTVFMSVAQRLYVLFRSTASADGDSLRRALSVAEQPHQDAVLGVLAATRGLYFYLLDEVGSEFSETFGVAFQRYREALVRTKLGNSHVLAEDDEPGAGWKGKTNDFTVFDQDKAALFECKTSGLFFRSKSHASLSEVRADIKKNLSNPQDRSGLFQLYDKLKAIRENRCGHHAHHNRFKDPLAGTLQPNLRQARGDSSHRPFTYQIVSRNPNQEESYLPFKRPSRMRIVR